MVLLDSNNTINKMHISKIMIKLLNLDLQACLIQITLNLEIFDKATSFNRFKKKISEELEKDQSHLENQTLV